MINKYFFGSIVIDEEEYDYDVEVCSTSIKSEFKGKNKVSKWQREESHLINQEDVGGAVEQNPDMIIIGTGESGIAQVSAEAQKAIIEKGIRLVVDKTEQAIKTFNIIDQDSLEEEGEERKVIGLFHLTC